MNFDKPLSMSFSEVAIIAASRAMLGLGVGLLVASRFDAKQRSALGRTLVTLGVVTTIPLALDVMAKLGAFSKQSQDTSGTRMQGRARQWAEQNTGVW